MVQNLQLLCQLPKTGKAHNTLLLFFVIIRDKPAKGAHFMQEVLKKYTICYVEDDLNIQSNMKELLEYSFNKVYVASDGREGFELYKKVNPDVIMLDINLPFIDGLTLAKKIRQMDKKIKIVILTAYTDKEKLLKATELNLIKYLVKPINPIEFDKVLETLSQELMEESKNCHLLENGIRWDSDTKTLYQYDKELPLSVKEQRLLELFIKNANSEVTFEDIMARVWIEDFDKEISINSVKAIVSRLRKKLPPNTIKNAYGKGYIFHCLLR